MQHEINLAGTEGAIGSGGVVYFTEQKFPNRFTERVSMGNRSENDASNWSNIMGKAPRNRRAPHGPHGNLKKIPAGAIASLSEASPYIGAAQLADRLHVSRSTIHEWCKWWGLKCYPQTDGSVIIDAMEFLEWARNGHRIK